MSDGLICRVQRGSVDDLYVDLWIKNGGSIGAGAFRVARVIGEEVLTPDWSVGRLGDGVEDRLERRPVGSQVSRFYVDVDEEVAESDESNNLWMPTKPAVPPGVTATLPAPPTCVPLATPTASPTAQPSQSPTTPPTSTPTPSSTPTSGPSPTVPSPTPTPSATPTGPLPDLLVSEGLICRVQRGSSDDLYVDLWIKNGGSIGAGAFRVARISGEDFREPEWRVSRLGDGVEDRLERRPVGSQVSRFYVDADAEVAESDESNNLWMPTMPAVPPGVTATLPAPPTCVPLATPTPVLDVADLDGHGTYDCARSGVWLTVRNTGLAAAGPFIVTSTIGGRLEFDGIAARAETRVFDPGHRLRNYLIDPDNVVPENDETNNEVAVAFPVCPRPGSAFLPFANVRRSAP